MFELYGAYYSRANIRLTGEYPHPSPGRQRFRMSGLPWSSIALEEDDSVDGAELLEINQGRSHVVFGPNLGNVPGEGDLLERARVYMAFKAERLQLRTRNRSMRLRYPNDIVP